MATRSEERQFCVSVTIEEQRHDSILPLEQAVRLHANALTAGLPSTIRHAVDVGGYSQSESRHNYFWVAPDDSLVDRKKQKLNKSRRTGVGEL